MEGKSLVLGMWRYLIIVVIILWEKRVVVEVIFRFGVKLIFFILY